MLMTQTTTNTATHLQTSARRFLLTACTVLLMGVMGAAAIKVDERTDKPLTAARAADATPVLLAAAHVEPIRVEVDLLVDVATAAAEPVSSEVRKPRTIKMEVTAYCPCTLCCGPAAQGLTASGKDISYNDGRFVAADTSVLPFGTKLVIPGYAEDATVEVIDRGGAIKGNKLDLFFYSHEEALQWGRQIIEVTVAE